MFTPAKSLGGCFRGNTDEALARMFGSSGSDARRQPNHRLAAGGGMVLQESGL